MTDPSRRLQDYLAGYVYGLSATCGSKINYQSEPTAQNAALAMNSKVTGKDLEPYPCVWCAGWHIGRAMTAQERKPFQDIVDSLPLYPVR